MTPTPLWVRGRVTDLVRRIREAVQSDDEEAQRRVRMLRKELRALRARERDVLRGRLKDS